MGDSYLGENEKDVQEGHQKKKSSRLNEGDFRNLLKLGMIILFCKRKL